MKKLIKKITFMMLLLMPGIIHAAGNVGVSTSYMDVQVGTSGTITLCANNSAGRIDMYSSNSGIASIDKSKEFLDASCTSVNVYGASVGTTTIVFNVVDVTTYDGEDLSGRNMTVTVNVYQPSSPQGGGGGGGYTPRPQKDGNTGLSSLSIEGYTVNQDGNKYTAEVPNDVEKIVIHASPSSSTSVVSGTGEKTLNVGVNEFSINVKAENGASQTYFVIVTRKSEYIKVSELNDALEKDKNTISVKLEDGDILSLDLLNKIKKSKKIVNLYFFDGDGKVLYTWVVDSSKINPTEDFNPIINLNVKNSDVIKEEINFVESVIIEFNSVAPEGVRLRLNTSGKYTKEDTVYIYSYKDKLITMIGNNATGGKPFSADNTDFIEFTPTSDVIYILSKGSLIKAQELHQLAPEIYDDTKSYLVPSIVELVCIVLLIAYIGVLHFNKYKKVIVKDDVNEPVKVETTPEVKKAEAKPAVKNNKTNQKVVTNKTVSNKQPTQPQTPKKAEPVKKAETASVSKPVEKLEPLDTKKLSSDDLVSANTKEEVIVPPKVENNKN